MDVSTFQSSLFLLLPAELRNVIYKLLLTSPYISQMRRLLNRNYCSDYVLPPIYLCLALLSTCKQINSEATSILYGENKFSAHPSLLTSLPHLVKSSKPICHQSVASQIRKWYINVRLDCDPNFTKEQATAAFSGVEEVEIEVYQAQYGSCDYQALMLFVDVRGVKRARVYGSVKEGFGKWLAEVMTSPAGSAALEYEDLAWQSSMAQERYDIWTHGGR